MYYEHLPILFSVLQHIAVTDLMLSDDDCQLSCINSLECTGNYSATSNDAKLVHWPLMGGLLHLVQRGRAAAPPSPLLAVPNVTAAHPSTASVPITVLMYNGTSLCAFNVATKG